MRKLKTISIILVALAFTMACAAQSAKPEFYCYDGQALRNNKADLTIAGNENIDAYKALLKDAEKALLFKTVSVMEKKNNPPSGDKHDYMSLAPYWWPDSSKADGLPYIRRDGVTNPEVKDYLDKDYMPQLCKNVETLALAYFFSGENKYALHAANLIRVWFLNPETKMNPNLNYAQAIKGRNDGRGAGIIDSRQFIKVVNAAGLLLASPAWKKSDDLGLRKWYADFLHWMETSECGLDEADAPNNHGAWYDAQRIAFAAYAGDKNQVKAIAENAVKRIDKQIDEEGFFPKELERTISLHYSAFVLDAFFTIAQVAKNNGIDIYHTVTPSRKSLQKAFNTHLPFFLGKKKWISEQIKEWKPEECYMILMEASKEYKCKDCKANVLALEGEKASRLRIKLLY